MNTKAAFAISIALSVSSFAQTVPVGTVRGNLTDDQGASLPGATIRASSPSLGGERTAVSDSAGYYRLLDLPPGEYVITAELQGFKKASRPRVVVLAGLNLVLNMRLSVGAMEETIEVTAETPMLERQSTTQTINVEGDFQRRIPVDGNRNWYNVLEVVPGMTARQGSAGLSNHYMLRGSEIEVNRVMVDGADISSFRQGRVDYVGFSTDAIDDVQVKTGGIDASAPLGSGVVVNIATPSGTNHFKGAIGGYATPKSWNGSNTPDGTSASREIYQVEGSIGGPILKDKAWFYAASRYSDRSLGISRNEKLLKDLTNLQPGFSPFPNTGKLKYYYLKVTTQLSTRHQANAFWTRNINPEDSNRVTNAEPFENQSLGGDAYGARLSSTWGSSVTSKLMVSYNNNTLNRDRGLFDDFLRAGPSRVVHERASLSSGRLVGNGEIANLTNLTDRRLSPATKLTFQGDLTFFKSGWGGTHEFQVGFFLQPSLVNKDTTYYSNDGFSLEEVVLRNPSNSAGGYIPFHRRFYDVAELQTRGVKGEDYAVYLQDAWRPNSRLTINAGIRVDLVKTRDTLFGVNIQDGYNVGPRFGVTYALSEDGNNVVRGHWGRLHELVNGNYITSAGSTATRVVDRYDNNLDGVFETEFITPASNAVRQDRAIDPDRTQPFTDEFLLGYRRQFAGQLAIDLAFVSRKYKSLPALVETNGIYDGGVFRGYKDENFNQIFLITNNTWNTFNYKALELTVAKRAKRVQILGGFTKAFQKLDGTWQPNDPAAFIQPGAFANDKCIGTIRGESTNSLSGTADTRCSSWADYGFRMGITVDAAWGLKFATQYTLLAGPWSGPVVTRLTAADPAFGPATLRLSNGRNVSNPLATTVRFAYANRGEGQVQAPAQHLLGLRLGKQIKLRSTGLEIAVDVLNLLNSDADQEFLGGGNQLYSPNFAAAPDGSFRGQSRVFPRSLQLSARLTF
jgi:Carboxypeptidase regulatory-like domain/TonB-dependent Receptor Plug Domain/TonB dependent receptor